MPEIARTVADEIEKDRRYRRELTVVRALIALSLVVAFVMPMLVAIGVAAVATSYAFIYRRHIGIRWVLLPALFAFLFAVAAMISAFS